MTDLLKSGNLKEKSGAKLWKVSVFIIFTFHSLLFTSASAQPVAVAKLDTTNIRIGEQAHILLSIHAPKDLKVFAPAIPDTFHKLEVVTRSKIDTSVSQDGKTISYNQTITITGFDSGYYVIEPIPVFFQKGGDKNTDSIATETMLMQVQSVPVDTTQEIKDIKPPVEVPFTFRDALPYIAGALIIAIITLFILRWMDKRKKVAKQESKVELPTRPPHEIALEELKKVEAQKIWQAGHYKQYHSLVADILRTYIEHRYGISSLEMPSDDTLAHVKSLIPSEAYEKLNYVLRTADMVKFAKAIPIGSENEMSMHHAIDFVMLTKPVTKDDFQKENKSEVVS